MQNATLPRTSVPRNARVLPVAVTVSLDGTIAGYASLFDIADQGGDIVAPGAFRDSLKRRGHAGIRMLFQHDPKEPVGIWTTIVEDSRGLYVEGRLTLDNTRARDLDALIRAGAVDGLSIGFKTVTAQRLQRSSQRRLVRIDLWEISIVTFPMLDGARILRSPSSTYPRQPKPRDTPLVGLTETIRANTTR